MSAPVGGAEGTALEAAVVCAYEVMLSLRQYQVLKHKHAHAGLAANNAKHVA